MTRDFLPTASLDMLQARSDLLKQIRRFFDDRNFMEVDTPVLSRDTVVDQFIEPISVDSKAIGLHGESKEWWLQTSPEFCMKRLLAAGATEIYQIAHAFRAGEWGDRHNPEFSMLEWYRVGDSQQQGIDLLGEFACHIFGTEQFEQVTYRDLFKEYVGVDGLSEDVAAFSAATKQAGIECPGFDSTTRVDDWKNLLLAEAIEPNLGREVPIVVFDWPASQSALAICRDETPAVAERFELYYRGTELANGYHELIDAAELLRRNRMINRLRIADGKRSLPESSRLLKAMEAGIKPCSGVAVGIDRLLMMKTGRARISEVTAFPISIA